jgi:hypothetical protein
LHARGRRLLRVRHRSFGVSVKVIESRLAGQAKRLGNDEISVDAQLTLF